MRSPTFATGCGFRSMAMPGTDTSCLSPATPLSHPPHSHCAAGVRGRAQEARRGRRTCNSKGSADALTSGLRRPPRAACSPSSPGCLSRLRAKFLVPLALLSGLGLGAPALAAADTTAPTIASVTLSSTPSFDADGDNTADTYLRGDRIVVDVRFSEAVTVSGGNNGVRLRLDLGADDTNRANSRRVLKLKSVVGGDTLRFEHRVARRDSDPDGVWVQTLTATNARTVLTVGATVASTATGTAAVLTMSGLPTAGAANHKVDGSRTQAPANRAPTFVGPERPVTLYLVEENNAAGAAVTTVTATDPDGDVLTYSLDSASDALFDIDSSGNITVTAANTFDHETQSNYTITVSVHDGRDAAGAADTTVDASRFVRVVVADAEEPPVFPANAPTTLEVAENNAAGAPVGTVSATDSDGDALTYALDSASDAVFDIDSSGNITVTAANALDYETKASYAVTVSVHDGKDESGAADTTVDATHGLTITVTDVQETTSGPPTISSVTLSSTPSFDADGDNTADTYIRGDRIVVDVRFSEAVTVSGGNNSVRLRLDLGTDDMNRANSRRVLTLKSVVGGDTLRFEHRVARRDSDPDGVWVQTASVTDAQTVFTLGGAAVASTATGVAAVLTKSGLPTAGAANHNVDGSRTPPPPDRAPEAAPAQLEGAATEAQGRGLVLTFTKDILIAGVHTDYAVLVGGERREIRSAFWEANTVGLVLAEPVRWGETVTVAYAKPPGGAILRDADELAIESFGPEAVANTVPRPENVRATPEPVVEVLPTGGSSTSTRFVWRLPLQPAGVIVNAVKVQVLPGRFPPWRTVASLAPVADGEQMAHTVIGLNPGEVNIFRLRLVTNIGNADSKNIVLVKLADPKPVTNLSVSNVTRTTADLSWTMPPVVDTSPVVGQLNVQQRAANGGWTTVATIIRDDVVPPSITDDDPYDRTHRLRTAHTVTGLTPGTSYTFRIRLVANANADSKTVSTTTLGASLNPAGGLAASNPTPTTIHLAWALPDQPAGVAVTGLQVQQQSAGSWTTVASLGASETSYTATGLTEGTTYTFRVRLAANNGTVDSETVSATALAPPKPATGLAASNQSRTGIDLSWTLPAQSPGVTVSAVEVQHKLGAIWSKGWSTVATLASDAKSYKVTQVTPGTNYAFRIRLATNNGHADSKSVTAAALEPPKPATGLSFSNVTGTTVDLAWTLPAQPEGVIVTAVEVHSGGLIKPGDENVPDFSTYGVVELAGDATSTTWPVLHGGFTHNFRVRLVTNSGDVDSTVASWSSTRPYPRGATELTASNATQTTVELAWTLPEQPGVTVSAVKVSWSSANERHGWSEEALAADATSHTVTGLSAGTAYEFHVVLVTSSGNPNSRLSVTTPSGAESAPGVSVADASATEGVDAVVEFKVSLSQTASGTVTVDYATADASARAGQDYTAVSGTLTFAPGERAKTVSVPILDDAIDEGRETFRLKLRNVQGAWISDGEATGTITNSDPLQKMWLSRFGRTVAGHVTDAVSDRLSGPLTGAQVTVGGQSVDLARAEDEAWLGEALTSVARALGASEAPGLANGDGWPGTGLGTRESATLESAPARSISGRELLLGSSFHLAKAGDGGAPGLAAWGRVTVGGFDGEAPADAGSVGIDGNVTTGILGADAEWDRLLAGVAVSVSEGEGTFDQPGVDSGAVESTMTTVSPYARVSLNERVSVWGLAGYGTGDMTIVQKANDATGQPERITRTDLSMRLAALGGRGALLTADEAGGFDLALKADGFFVETTSEAISNEGDTTADASRVRLALEGSRAFELGDGVLTPGLELGLRHDGGDAETGTGVELGGRVSWTDPDSGLSVEGNVRALIAHEDSKYREWGASGALRLAPGERGRGLSFSLAPTYGTLAGGMDRLWSAQDARGLAPTGGTFEPESRLEGELGYGLPLFGDRFTGTPNVGFGLTGTGARDYRIGWRLTSVVRGDPGFEVNLDATRREPANDNGAGAPVEHGVMLRGAIRW